MRRLLLVLLLVGAVFVPAAHAESPYVQCGDTHTYGYAVCAVRQSIANNPASFGDPAQPVRCYYAGKKVVWDHHGRMADSHSTRLVRVFPRWSCHTATAGRFVVLQWSGEVYWVLSFKAA